MNDSRRFFAQGFMWTLSLVALMLLTACETTRQTVNNQNGGTKIEFAKLQPGDLVSVSFSGVPIPPEKFEGRIKEDGTISIPYIGSIQAANKITADLEKTIHDLYVPKYYNSLNVVVNSESRAFYVYGEVRMPNRYNYIGETTVTAAIATAGGFTDFANKRHVQLIRADGQSFFINCTKALKDPSLDLKVYPLDRIYVKRRWT